MMTSQTYESVETKIKFDWHDSEHVEKWMIGAELFGDKTDEVDSFFHAYYESAKRGECDQNPPQEDQHDHGKNLTSH